MTETNTKTVETYKHLFPVDEATFTKDKFFLEEIWSITEKQLKSLLKFSDAVPEELDYILPLVVVKRYNRFGHEGMESYSQSEESIKYSKHDFDEYATVINDYVDSHNLARRRSVNFL